MSTDYTAFKSRLPVIVLLVLCTGLSVVFYLGTPFREVGEIAVANAKPSQRNIASNLTLESTGLQNTTQRTLASVSNTDNPKTVTQDFMIVNGEEQRRRKAVLRDACKRYKVSTRVDIRNHPPPSIYVDDEHKVLYCSVPKIACTSWKKVFLVMNRSFKTTEEISQYYANRKGKKLLKELRDCSPLEVSKILSTYTKFVFARHPFSRVLSAFRNKLDPDSTFERATIWQRSTGKRIIERYRDKDVPTSHEYDLTFEEFVQFLIDPEAGSNNHHWSEIYKQCLPCDIDYDVIGKFETLQSDYKYIMRRIHAEDIPFPGSDSSSPTGSSNQSKLELHYKNVPLVDLQKLYERFRIDFALFGYDPLCFRSKVVSWC